MKIAHVITYFQPEFGYEEYFSARIQAELGHEVHVVTSDRIAPFRGFSLVDRLRKSGIEEREGFMIHRLPTLIEPYNDFGIVRGTATTLRTISPEVVHVHTLRQSMGFTAASQKRKLGYVLISDNHEYFYRGHPMMPDHMSAGKMLSGLEYRIIRTPMGRYICRMSDALVSMDTKTYAHVKEYLRMDHPYHEILPLGVDERKYCFKANARNRVRRQLGLLTDTVVLVFAGILDERKKLEEYVSLMAELRDLRIVVLLIGPCEEKYQRRIMELSARRGVERQVFFLGQKSPEEMPDYYSAADIALWMSSSSVSILEAMACERPIIHALVKQFSSMVTDETGQLFTEGDVENCAAIVRKFAENLEFRTRLGVGARRLISERYGYIARTEKLCSLYKRCIERAAPGNVGS